MTKQYPFIKSGCEDFTGDQSFLIALLRKEVAAPNGSTKDALRLANELLQGFLSVAQPVPVGMAATQSQPPGNRQILRLLEEIQKDPFADWTVAKLCQTCGKSRTSFSGSFIETTGVSPIKYIRQLRIRLACEQILSGDLSIDQIAYEVGYADTSGFNRAFKREMGMAPGAFRKKQGANNTFGIAA